MKRKAQEAQEAQGTHREQEQKKRKTRSRSLPFNCPYCGGEFAENSAVRKTVFKTFFQEFVFNPCLS